MKHLFLSLIIVFNLIACGGGSEQSAQTAPTTTSNSASQTSSENADTSSSTSSSNSDANSENSSGSNSEDTSENNNTGTIMTDLIIDQSFTLKTDFDLLIDAKIAANNVRAYLNICQSFANTGKADYQNCVLRKPLKNGELKQQITLSRQDIALVAEIWLYDSNPEPLRYQWQYDENVTKQQFEIRY
jgi:uncharacterized protein YcfL